MKLLVLILLLNHASAEAEAEAKAEAEANPNHRSVHSGQVKKVGVKITNPKLIHTSHVIQNQKGAFQVWLVKGQAKATEGKHQRDIVKGRTNTLERFKQRNIEEVERSSSISNSLDSLTAPGLKAVSHQHPPPSPGFSPLAATCIFHFHRLIVSHFRS